MGEGASARGGQLLAEGTPASLGGGKGVRLARSGRDPGPHGVKVLSHQGTGLPHLNGVFVSRRHGFQVIS